MTTKNTEKKSNLLSHIPKPQYSFSEIPGAMQHSIIGLTMLCLLAIFCCVGFSIMSTSWKPIVGAALLFALWCYTIFLRCLPFMYGKALYFEGEIIEQKGRAEDHVSGVLAKKVMAGTGKYLYVKHGIDTYKITIPGFKAEYGAGGKVRVYFVKGGCYEQSKHYFIILEPLLIESLNVNIA